MQCHHRDADDWKDETQTLHVEQRAEYTFARKDTLTAFALFSS
jgi:hypothetical protein